MPDPTRADLMTALDELLPKLRGLRNTANDTLSPEAMAAVEADILNLKRRYSLIQAVLKEMDTGDAAALAAAEATAVASAALLADGFPVLPPAPVVPVEVFDELQRVRADDNAGIDRFKESTAARKMEFQAPVTKDKPVR